MGTYGSVKINADAGSYTYTLDNSKPEVQALAFKQHETDTFTYTITDSKGATSSTTLTVYVNGKNDAPVITINGTDSASASLAETNSGLTTAGTLSIFDVDTSDKVTVSKAPAFSVDGSYAGPRPSDTLKAFALTVSGGEPSRHSARQSARHQLVNQVAKPSTSSRRARPWFCITPSVVLRD